jgi:hypothetical protein
MRPLKQLPDQKYYQPEFSPWKGHGEFGKYLQVCNGYGVSEKQYYLYSLLLQTIPVPGHVVECGVFCGWSAILLGSLMKDKCPAKRLLLFDTFCGIPDSNPELDAFEAGDFGAASFNRVRSNILLILKNDDFVTYFVGPIPRTFSGCENLTVSLVHVDVDVYEATKDCLEFFWPRLSPGGVMVLDDYGHPNTTGAKKACDEFFTDKKEKPIALQKGQAFAIKGW